MFARFPYCPPTIPTSLITKNGPIWLASSLTGSNQAFVLSCYAHRELEKGSSSLFPQRDALGDLIFALSGHKIRQKTNPPGPREKPHRRRGR